jgi:hypothetical protein
MTGSTQILQAALRDLELRQKDLREEMTAVEAGIAGIRAVLARDASLLVQIPQNANPLQASISQATRYAGMSVRWGVLQYLAEDANGPASTAEIAAALLKGGMTTQGRDFISNVSAVISVMVNKRQELEPITGEGAGSYRLTQTGHSAWHAIKMTNQYQARSFGFSPNVQ